MSVILLKMGLQLSAGPTESAIVAAMKIPDAKSYSWLTYVEDDARTYEIRGKTDQTNFSLVTMPMISAIRRKLTRGLSNSDNQVEAIFRGSDQCVIQTPEGWKTPTELNALPRLDQRPTRATVGGYPGAPTRRGRKGGGASETALPYSNLQLNLSRPHEEIGVIIGSFTDMKFDGEVVSGTLSETGAKLLLVHPGQNELTPLTASGTFRLWVNNGSLTKYELRLDGTLAVETPSARREVKVHQKSTTEIRAIGVTTVEIPEEVREKFRS